MSVEDKINSALGIDVDKIIDEVENDIPEVSDGEIEKYREKQNEIKKLRKDLKDARSLKDPVWSEMLLKKCAENSMEVQERFRQEIEDDPCSKNVTAFSELGNSIVNIVNGVLDITREQEKIDISKEKNRMRMLEIDGKGGGMIDSSSGGSKVIGVGSNDDLLKLINKGINPAKGAEDAVTEEKEG